MALSAGTRLGHYEILALLGAGGMGEVYRARDTQLGRAVAIKALPAGFAADPERLARFEREARLLASLSHPHIAGIHGVVEADGRRYLALELIEGESLAQRIARGPLPLDEALPVCEQIAAALEAAHDAGIVHRDLKPANVVVRTDGTVKVLDFGLAKGPAGSETGSDLSQSPTLTSPMTSPGMILGTAAYMSPEQARGRAVDRRADSWAWGCVLYECLTGKRAFPGEDISETLAAILKDTPDWSALPHDTPQRVRELLARCLTKDPRERQRDLGDARLELAAARREGPAMRAAAAAARPMPGAWAVAALAAALAAGALGGFWIAHLGTAPAAVRRFEILPPDQGASPLYRGQYALSPDGRQLVASIFETGNSGTLYVRSIESGEWRKLEGTDGADYPFWSPDGRDIAFFAHGRLKRIPAAGGEPQDLCAARQPRGGAWSRTHEILFSGSIDGPLEHVAETGGTPVPISHPPGYEDERYPVFLPDGVHFLYMAKRLTSTAAAILFGSLRDGAHLAVVDGAYDVGFMPPDRMLYLRGPNLFEQRLDLTRGVTLGPPVNTLERPSLQNQIDGTPPCSVTSDGTMIYATQDRRTTDATWFDRGGHRLLTVALGLPGILTGALSADGTHLAANADDLDGPSVFVFDLERGGRVALPGSEDGTGSVVWSADGSHVLTSVFGPGHAMVAALDASGNGGIKPIALNPDTSRAAARETYIRDCARDGATLVIGQPQPGTGWDILAKRLGDSSAPVPYASTPAYESDARLSHDGRWLAYVSDASGTPEVYVDAFPKPAGPHRLSTTGVPTGGGPDRFVWWRKDDAEIEYLGGDGRTVYAAAVRTVPTLELGTPRPLFVAPEGTLGVEPAPDGQRFLVLLPHGTFASTFTVVLGGNRWRGSR